MRDVQKTQEKVALGMCCGILVWGVVVVGILGAIVWVAAHFLAKVW